MTGKTITESEADARVAAALEKAAAEFDNRANGAKEISVFRWAEMLYRSMAEQIRESIPDSGKAALAERISAEKQALQGRFNGVCTKWEFERNRADNLTQLILKAITILRVAKLPESADYLASKINSLDALAERIAREREAQALLMHDNIFEARVHQCEPFKFMTCRLLADARANVKKFADPPSAPREEKES